MFSRIGLSVFLVILLSACATRTALDTHIVGKCLETQVDMYWLAPRMARDYSSDRMLSANNQPRVYIADSYETLDRIPGGTRISIYQIERWDRYGESYLRVHGRMEEGEYADELFDLPVCAPFHIHPRHIRECTMNPDHIRFDPKYLAPCEEAAHRGRSL